MTRVSLSLGFAAACLLAAPSSAQLNQQWVSFTKDTSRLAGGSGSVSNNGTEVDFCWGDIDKDGVEELYVLNTDQSATRCCGDLG